jgi:hypothetical protein
MSHEASDQQLPIDIEVRAKQTGGETLMVPDPSRRRSEHCEWVRTTRFSFPASGKRVAADLTFASAQTMGAPRAGLGYRPGRGGHGDM